MTNELEKQFFDTFGIELNCQNKFINPSKCPFVESRECCDCVSFVYPQITDRILLGIIAKIMWSYSCTQNDFDVYEVSTAENLKEEVLKHAIKLSKYDAYVYTQVKALFEEG